MRKHIRRIKARLPRWIDDVYGRYVRRQLYLFDLPGRLSHSRRGAA